MKITCWLSLFVLLFLHVPDSRASELRISAAASLTDSLTELSKLFKGSYGEVDILTNFASSGALAKQINQGASVDIYISANPRWMDFLIEQGRIVSKSRKTLVYNSLVFAGRNKAREITMNDLTSLELIAIGSPKSVPAGQYAVQAMTSAGVYDRLLSENRLVMAKDVRQALVYADRGETDGAFVYNSDARLAGQAVLLFTVSQELYSRVTYPVALTPAGKNNSAAGAYYDFLFTSLAAEVLSRYGFTPVTGN